MDSGAQTLEDASKPEPDLLAGSKFDRYVILEQVGEGGFGAVYAAYDPKLDRKVALKVLRSSGKEYEARLLREAQAMARLSHPNVVSVFDTGIVGDRLFLAMEFVQGVTLRKWQKAATRPWPEILKKYLEAGRGLDAAHVRELVHRDFKPDNVLLADTGEVKVTDFGIVRLTSEAKPEGMPMLLRDLPSRPKGPPPNPDDAEATLDAPPMLDLPAVTLGTPVTELGSLVGTPGYMAPEQYLLAPLDARTDQFAFAVALYEALYGKRPFGGDNIVELAHAALEGRVREAPKTTDVPVRVRRILLRSLEAEREKRYPSMSALLADLARDPARDRRRVLVVALGVVAVVGVALGLQRAAMSRGTELCTGADALSREVWNPAVAAAIEKSLVATELPFAQDSAMRTRRQLDDYMERWAVQHRQTCEATRVRGEQSDVVMTARMACLEDARREVGALASVLSSADKAVASRAVEASLALPGLERCKDVTSLTAMAPEPTGTLAKAEIAGVRDGLAKVKAELEAGKVSQAADDAAPLVPRARSTSYLPLVAEVLLVSAIVKAEGGTRDASIAEATDAVFTADVARADAIRAEAATRLLQWMTDAGHRPDAERWSRVAEAALDRGHDDGDDRVAWLVAGALALEDDGKYRESRDKLAAALALARRAGSGPQRIADTERMLAGKLAAIGDVDEAQRLVTEASESIRRTVGDEHPARIPYLLTMGYVASERADYKAGLASTREAIHLAERIAPDHMRLPVLYNNESNFLFELHDYEGALAAGERTVATALKVFGPDSVQVAYGYSAAGNALVALGRFDDAAARYERAVAIHEKAAADEPDLVQALTGWGRARTRAGNAAAAIPMLERALALMSKTQLTGMEGQRLLADAQLALAQALWQSGSRAARIGDLAQAALATQRATKNAGAVTEIESWLEHRPPTAPVRRLP